MLSEDCAYKKGQSRNDYGWAIGMGQWHIRWRYTDWMKANGYSYPKYGAEYVHKMREHFFQDHPDMKDWRHQAHKYLDEMNDCTKDNSIDHCIRKWNWNAGLPYLNKVKRTVHTIQRMLS